MPWVRPDYFSSDQVTLSRCTNWAVASLRLCEVWGSTQGSLGGCFSPGDRHSITSALRACVSWWAAAVPPAGRGARRRLQNIRPGCSRKWPGPWAESPTHPRVSPSGPPHRPPNTSRFHGPQLPLHTPPSTWGCAFVFSNGAARRWCGDPHLTKT